VSCGHGPQAFFGKNNNQIKRENNYIAFEPPQSVVLMRSQVMSQNAMLRAGDEIGEYIVLAELGKGSYGTIFRVEHKQLKRRFAFKVTRKDLKDSKSSDQLINEFRAYTAVCAALSEKKIEMHSEGCFPEVYWCQDIESERGTFTVVCMQLLHMNLEEAMTSTSCKKLSLHSVLMIGYQMLIALIKLHTCGIIHCDIKIVCIW
jgi:serine/threonine protein kinase